MRRFIDPVIYSMPMQLLFLHFRKNLALLAVWGIIVASFTGGLGSVYGINYLFLDPEYLGEVSFWSFFWIGLAYGNLIISFHITSYILDSHRFRFIGTLERPFTKFSVNNSLVPLIILGIYLFSMVRFQTNNEFATNLDVISFILGLLIGINSFMFLMFVYFRFTNKDIFKFVAKTVDKRLRKGGISKQRMMKMLKENRQDRYKVESYFDLRLSIRPVEHFNVVNSKEAILKVFDQNHFNSVVIELVIIGIILMSGFFLESPVFQIPAAASAMMIFSIAVMLVGAISFWFKSWGLPFAILLFILANIAVKHGFWKEANQAAGVDYSTKASYSLENLNKINSAEQYAHDKMHMLNTLENWRKKWPTGEKQKMIFLCASGGGQRAALWTVNSLLHADSVLNGKLMDHTFFISGASGGIVGTAYFREMFRQGNVKGNRAIMLENMGKDNLNPIIFGLLVNDLFMKFQSYNFNGREHPLDRGFIFEENLNRNLGGVLSMKMSDYYEDEKAAKIPVLLMSPIISNDGRKLFISSQPVSYMGVSSERVSGQETKIRGVSFTELFAAQSAKDLSFLSALRMSASFPYITPTISLPSEPRIEIMDAGISDNFGVTDAVAFIHTFREWLEENTAGIVLLVVRDTRSDFPIAKRSNLSITDKVFYPIASVYNNLSTMQDANNDKKIEQAKSWFDADLDVIEIAYNSHHHSKNESETKRASLSWHLTTREKQNLIENIEIESNQQALDELRQLVIPQKSNLLTHK